MQIKLTSGVVESIIKRVKICAKHSGRSLSALVENYLDNLTVGYYDKEKLSPKLKKSAGGVTVPKDFDEKKELSAYFEKKYLNAL